MYKLLTLVFTLLTATLGASAAERLLVIGDAAWSGWCLDRAAVMTPDSADTDIWHYTGYLNADKEFKFLTECSWDRLEYRNASATPLITGQGRLAACNTGDRDYKFTVAQSANYHIACNLHDLTINVERTAYQTKPVLHNVLYLVGDATPGGWFLGNATPLTQDSQNPLRYSATVLLQPGIFKIATNPYGGYNEQKFYFRDATDSGRVSEDGTDDRQWRIDADGLYTVTVDLDAMTIDISRAQNRTALGQVLSWTDDGTAVSIQCQGGTLTVTPYNDQVIKIFTLAAGSTETERRSISVYAQPNCNYAVTDGIDNIRISTATTIVEISRSDARVSFSDRDGHVRLREATGLDNSAIPRQIAFEGMADRAFYGGGYNGKHVNLDGQNLVMDNTQTGGWDNTWNAPHNICIPFVVSTSGYGLLVDDHYRGARLRPSSTGTTYVSGSHNPIAYYYVGSADGSLGSGMDNYTRLTGRQPLPPYWALGYMTSRYGYHSRQEAEQVVDGIRQAGLPLDGIVFDLYWQGEGNSGMGNLDWYKPLFDNPAEMMQNFSDRGVHTVCITEPFFTSVSANYEPLRQLGYLADDDVSDMGWLGAPKVGLIDSSNPAAMDWMWQWYRQRTAEGISGWWLDLGEPERHDADSRHMGGTVNQVHNEFADLWTERVYRGYCQDFADVRPFLMPRAGTAGMQRYSTFPWSGDIRRSYAGLAAQIPALLSSGMSGVAYMGNDVGGFAADSNDPRLYLRWIQMSTFAPMLRTHGTKDPEPHLPCYADVLPHVRCMLNLRYSYLPYTYTLAWQNAVSGAPLARPLNYHDTDAAAGSSADCIDQYLWGRDLMIAPVLTAAEERSIRFPQGQWLDLNDLRSVYQGGSTVSYSAPLAVLPHFARMGSFVPRYSATTYTSTADIDHSQLTVLYTALLDAADDTTVSSQLFDDDRTCTDNLQSGSYSLTTFTGCNTATGHEICIEVNGQYPGMPVERTYNFVIPNYNRQLYGISVTHSDGTVSTLPQDAYSLNADGSLSVRVTAPTVGTTRIGISDSRGAGVGNITAPAATVRYSAATGTLHIDNPGAPTTVTIHDVNGRRVATLPTPCGGSQHRPCLPAGLYIASLPGAKPVRIVIRQQLRQ